MLKVWSITNREHGFSAVEVLLATAVFATITTALIGASVYGRASTDAAGDRVRANMLAEEGIEAVRNMRDAAFSNLADGTYGLAQSGGVWNVSGGSDTNDIYTRQTTVASNGSNRKIVTSTVTWPQSNGGTSETSVSTQLANWLSALPKSWKTPTQIGSLDLTGTIAGFKVATNGNYAYLIRNSATGPNFFVINITTPSAPTVAGSMTLTGTPTNIAVSGNYAYVTNTSDTQELQIVNVTTPASPSQVGSYNASSTGDGKGVYVVGTTVYMARAANLASDEFVIVNAATPATPTRVGGYSLNIAMNDVYVNGTTAYVATGSDTQELLVLNITTPSAPTTGTSINLTGTTDATTITGNNNTLAIGQGTTLNVVSRTTPLAPTLVGSVVMPGTITDVTFDTNHNYVDVGTNYASGEFQVVDVNTPASPTAIGNVNVAGTTTVNGVAYNPTKDIVPAATALTNLEAVVFAPN